MELWLGAGLVAFVSFTVAALTSGAKPRPESDPGKPKFVVASAGCMGCLTAISVVLGILAAAVSLAASVKKFME